MPPSTPSLTGPPTFPFTPRLQGDENPDWSAFPAGYERASLWGLFKQPLTRLPSCSRAAFHVTSRPASLNRLTWVIIPSPAFNSKVLLACKRVHLQRDISVIVTVLACRHTDLCSGVLFWLVKHQILSLIKNGWRVKTWQEGLDPLDFCATFWRNSSRLCDNLVLDTKRKLVWPLVVKSDVASVSSSFVLFTRLIQMTMVTGWTLVLASISVSRAAWLVSLAWSIVQATCLFQWSWRPPLPNDRFHLAVVSHPPVSRTNRWPILLLSSRVDLKRTPVQTSKEITIDRKTGLAG